MHQRQQHAARRRSATEPIDMTARPPRRSIRRPTKAETALDDEQPDREAAEHEALAPAGVGGDRLAEHAQRVERGAPGDDLRDAERQRRRGVAGSRMSRPRAALRRAPCCALLHVAPRSFAMRLATLSARCRASASCPLDADGARNPIFAGTRRAPLNDKNDEEENRLSARGRRATCGSAPTSVRWRRGSPASACSASMPTTPRTRRPWRRRWAASRGRS